MTGSQKYFAAGVAALAALSRVPLLFHGYGADGDAWRIANVAHTLWTSGVYAISRPPGYPAYEILSAPLVTLGGAPLSNLFTVFAAVAAILAFHAIACRYAARPRILTVAFAFAPLFWANSAITMDYTWSLAMLLFALHAIMRERHGVAGILAGLMIGFRPSNAVMLVPLILLLVLPPTPGPSLRAKGPVSSWKSRLLSLLVPCLTTAGIVFLPVFFTYGFSGWLMELRNQYGTTALSPGDTLVLAGYRAVYTLGPLALVSIVWIAARRGALAGAWKGRDPLMAASAAALGVLSISFALFPLEKPYLLTGLPFLLLVLDRCATDRSLALFAAFLISFAFINPDLVRHGGTRGTPGVNIHAGLVIEEWQQRVELQQWRDRLASIEVSGPTVVMTGAGPAFWFENEKVEVVRDTIVRDVNDVVVQRRGDPSVLFVPMIPVEEAKRLERSGWHILIDARNRDYVMRTMGYPADCGF